MNEKNEPKTPTCATPTAIRPGNQSPAASVVAPPTLHQPASSVLNRPSQTVPWSPKIIWDSHSGLNGSDVQPAQPVQRQPVNQGSVPQANRSPENPPFNRSPQNHANVLGQGKKFENSNCVEMNFGDIDPCNPCPIPPACPTPLQSPWQCQESCVPVQTLPTPTAQGANSPCTPENYEMVPVPEQDPQVQIDDCSVPTPREITTHDKQPLIPENSQADLYNSERDKLLVEIRETSEPMEPDTAMESLPAQDGDFIFENAAFQIPNVQQQGKATEPDNPTGGHPVSAADSGAGIVVHPPMIQPYHKNQHTFVIENKGVLDAEDVTIEISVPENARIIAALPPNSVSTPQKALFKFDELTAGDKTSVHLTVIATNNESIPFEASVACRSDYSFRVHGQTAAGVLKNVSYSRNAVDDRTDVKSIPADDAYLGPVLVRNPFFQSLPRDHEAGLPANRR